MMVRGVLVWLLVWLPARGFAQAVIPDTATAQRLVDAGRFADAEAMLRGMTAGDAATAADHFLLGYVLFREHKMKESLAAYTAGARLRQPTPGELTYVALDYILLQDFADADRWLTYITKQAPGDANAWYLLGRTQYNEDHAEAAKTSFLRCLALRPKDLRARYNLGLAYEKLNQPNEAVAAYQAAIASQAGAERQDAQPYLDLGELYLRQGHADLALPPLQQAARIAASNPLAQQELGAAFEALGRYAEAVAPLERAASLAPGSQRPHFYLGRVYRRLGRAEDAAREFATVSKIAGTHSDTDTPNLE